ncbi:MAG: GDP-mannose 4,6-dehydratase [Deltaproteobacteria bacterium]|nr:GDP-mannose 4,6-dehydratase [Deltaproteobacteria bacterium]
MKKALICGVSGQDGAYLAQFLLQKGYEVYGGSRDAQMSSFANLKRLRIYGSIRFVSININDFRSAFQTLIKVRPDEVYNLAGQSSVGLSFEQPVDALESIGIGTLNILEAIRFSGESIKFYNAGSSECFGDTGGKKADETTSFRPRSPYAVAKATAFWEVANYREAYGLHASTGILFNHESSLRPKRFVTRKIITSACRIASGHSEKLCLGNIKIQRDWGWAPEFVEAMWKIVQQEKPDDYVIATGETRSLEDFIAHAFRCVDLNWSDHVVIDKSLFRPTDLMVSRANPSKAENLLNWKAVTKMDGVVEKMIEAETQTADIAT